MITTTTKTYFAVDDDGFARQHFATIGQANQYIDEYGTKLTTNASQENVAYWANRKPNLKIIKVIQIEEVLN